MKEINNKALIDKWVSTLKINENFDSVSLQFSAYQYDKGELIASPDRPLNKISFLISGTVLIYSIREDGRIIPLDLLTKSAILGDVEFCGKTVSPFYVQAKTAVTFVTLPIRRYHDILDQDLRFLHVILQSLSKKLEIFSIIDNTAPLVEERVLLYMKDHCPSSELYGIEAATFQLHCSRRQLQRALQKLCTEGKIVRTGKGRYRLVTD